MIQLITEPAPRGGRASKKRSGFMGKAKICLALAVFTLLILVPAGASAGAWAIADNGEARAAVIISDNASAVERHAADELCYFLGRVTGAEITQSEGPVRGKYSIWLGTPETNPRAAGLRRDVEALSEEGFVLQAGRDGLVITGKTPLGVLYGVYGFLEDHVGMRWFFPGDEGTYTPSIPVLSVGQMTDIQNPSFEIRDVRLHGTSHGAEMADTVDWIARNRMRVQYPVNPRWMDAHRKRGNRPFGGGHILSTMIPDSLFDEHPEYFGLYDGERRKQEGHRGQPCTTNPEVIKLAADYMIDWFNENPGGLFTLNNNDWPRLCECDDCAALDPPEEIGRYGGTISTRFFTFKNEVARLVWEALPDADIRVLAYHGYRLPPLGVVPDARLRVDLCDHERGGRCYRHTLGDPSCEVSGWTRGMFEGWSEFDVTRGIYTYYNSKSGGLIATPMERNVAGDMRYMHGLGQNGWTIITSPPDGRYDHIERRGGDSDRSANYWRANLQMHYVQAKLAWDIDADLEELLREINDKFYGPAGDAMHGFRMRLLELWEETTGHFLRPSPLSLTGRSLFVPGAPEELLSLLDEAEEAAGEFSEYAGRVQGERSIFERTWMRAYGETVDDPALMEVRGRISGNFERVGGISGGAVKFHQGAYLETENLYNNMPELTVSFFIWQPAIEEAAMHILGNNRSHAVGSPGFRFLKRRPDRGDGNIQFRVSDGSTQRIVSTDNLPTEEWAHVAGVFKGGEAICLYINGERVSRTGNPLKDTGESDSAFRIGVNETGESSLPGMMIDKVRIKDRALSDSEIRDLYSGATSG